jgi:hypothetical protein
MGLPIIAKLGAVLEVEAPELLRLAAPTTSKRGE